MELMATVKRESDRQLCDGCLSHDRTLRPVLRDSSGLLEHIFGHSVDLKSILLCWECLAVVSKMCRFQDQARYAQMMQQTLYSSVSSLHTTAITTTPIVYIIPPTQVHQQVHSTSCLSSLRIISLESTNIDPLGENKFLNESDNFVDPTACSQTTFFASEETTESKHVKIPKEEVFIPENGDFDYDYYEQLGVCMETKLEAKQEVKKDKKKVEKLKAKAAEPVKKHPLMGVKKYTGRAKIRKNPNIDLVNYEKNFIPTSMTEKEIERLGRSLVDFKKRGIKPICKPCQKQFVSGIDSKRHKTFSHILKEEPNGPFACLECKAACPDKESLRSHWNEAHNATHRCRFCGMKVTHAFEYKLHSEQHKYLLTCRDCKLPGFKTTFDNNKDFGYHFQTLHRRVLCDYCGRESYTTGALAKHIRKHHLPRTCKICDRTFDKYLAFQRHNISYHPELVERAESDEARYCVECDKHYPSVERYQRHLRSTTTHNPAVVKGWRNKIISCPECGKQFKRNKHMSNHYKLYHERKTDHYCSLCDKYLVSAYRLRTHVASVHLKIRPPKDKYCEVCGRGFGTNAILKNHMRTHTGERPYRCSLCPAAFTQSHPLKSHLKSQHNIDRSLNHLKVTAMGAQHNVTGHS